MKVKSDLDKQLVERCRQGFESKFGREVESVGVGAGRVEVIGNFTDQLEGGKAIGAPIDKFVVVAGGCCPP